MSFGFLSSDYLFLSYTATYLYRITFQVNIVVSVVDHGDGGLLNWIIQHGQGGKTEDSHRPRTLEALF